MSSRTHVSGRHSGNITRRNFIRTTAAASIALASGVTTAARIEPGRIAGAPGRGAAPRHLRIAEGGVSLDGEHGVGTLVEGQLPGPTLRFTEGDLVDIEVVNGLRDPSSIHWHGILLPSGMDGVPGLSFAGIAPGDSFRYRYPLRQSGTYWYHSHSGLQEQTGVYGALIIDPPQGHDGSWDREHVIVLSDWTFDDPHRVLGRLKKQSHYYNVQRPALADFFGADDPSSMAASRTMWARMRMDMSDIADVSAATYRYLCNGHTPSMLWCGGYRAGERVLLRVINASAMTLFDVRVPGLALSVRAMDGQPVEPVTCEEFRLGVAETCDVIVEPQDSRGYAVFAESLDRSGYAAGVLVTAPADTVTFPGRRPKPMRDLRDMSMPGHSMHGTAAAHAHHGHQLRAAATAGRYEHGPDHHGPGAAMVAQFPHSRLHEPGVGLDDAPHRVLRYSDLRAPVAWPDQRQPEREIELHLTGNMERYMWSFDGVRFHEVTEPIRFAHGERVRLVLVNDTMMEHPIHLHGMWMELDNGNGAHNPRKHTITVKPSERLAVNISADAPGLWAFHCHLLYHMHMGMMRAVAVT